MNQIDSIAYHSKLAWIDPKAKLCFSLVLLCVCIGCRSILVGALVLLVTAGATLFFARLSLRRYLHFLSIPLGFLLVGTLTIFISVYPAGEKLLAGIPIGGSQVGISAQSFLEGLRLCATALGAVGCMYFLSFNTPMTGLFALFRKSPLPEVVVSLMELIYRYIFVLWEEAATMKTAQNARLGYQGIRHSIASFGTLVGTLFFRAYQRCDRIYSALESRGYQGSLEALQEEYQPGKGWYGATFLTAAAALGIFFLERSVL
ncbi:Energy-coupling factor transporter transmembrane protein CbiQ [uncultured Ruminococcus sp.]|uniref:Cobalt ECF transporter T component CbiQ n=1 Tax=Massiliimalia timonensis TaxID=1987501 RepID=A0A8J6PGU2_9FIRM|nr:cobalt ECF transporter T component CbiQ [Massiliimalia timonensis]MBC8611777.1 cobalt ECF transporter T component CbiQ [Massiliimalia timonensis]SCH50050.1 Energy-coupling factor transporter transmembrane protein CbiQ [uncultured Clostridium sp.]SCH59438.1 Energy-coupling factor transporter transmembrane protein CbiQ [uncultured Ruminococcus sp.]